MNGKQKEVFEKAISSELTKKQVKFVMAALEAVSPASELVKGLTDTRTNRKDCLVTIKKDASGDDETTKSEKTKGVKLMTPDRSAKVDALRK